MPGFDSIIGQEQAVRVLLTFLRRRTIPHALLFTGIAGTGKRTAARVFAMALNCRAGTPLGEAGGFGLPCGACRSCTQIGHGTHPDVPLIEPGGSTLRVDQIRRLLGMLAMRPHSADYRVAILADAHALNAEAGNALLKILEEPPDRTILILTAHHKADLLPTIVSRCRHIRFKPLSPEDLAGLLRKTSGASAAASGETEFLAQLAGGSYTKAVELARGKWLRQRDWLVRAAGLAPTGPGDRPTTARALAFAGRLAQNSEQVGDRLVILQTWIRDLAVWPYKSPNAINRDCGALLERTRESLGDTQLLDLWEHVQKAQKAIAANANLRLTLEAMALGMAETINRPVEFNRSGRPRIA